MKTGGFLMRGNRGISLVVLVITIIIITILAGSVIVNFVTNNPIDKANEAKFKNNIEEYNSELAMFISNKYLQDYGFRQNDFDAGVWEEGNDINGTIKECITSITKEDGKKFEIQDGKLVYVGQDSKELEWANNSSLPLEDMNKGIKQISSNGFHSLVLLNDGTVKSWGDNSSGQLGIGYVNCPQKWPQNVISSMSDLSDISNMDVVGLWSDEVAGNKITIRFISDDSINCNGFIISKIRYIENGQVHEEKLTSPIVNLNYLTDEVKTFEITRVNATSISVNFALFDVEDGYDYVEVVNSSEQVMLTYTGELYLDSIYLLESNKLDEVKEVSAGVFNSFALMNDGTVKTWGLNVQNYPDEDPISKIPETVTGLSNVKQIVSSGTVTLALMNDGTVKYWGISFTNEGEEYITEPTTIPGLSNVKKVGAGSTNYVFLINDGTVMECGINATLIVRALELEEDISLSPVNETPTKIAGLNNVKDISIGILSNLALLEDGTVKCWGYNMNNVIKTKNIIHSIGDLMYIHVDDQTFTQDEIDSIMLSLEQIGITGIEANTDSIIKDVLFPYTSVPVTVEKISNAKSISMGGSHISVINNDDSLQIYGVDMGVQYYALSYLFTLGLVDMFGFDVIDLEEIYNLRVFSEEKILQNVSTIDSSASNLLALLKDGKLMSLGSNYFGQVGDGTSIYKELPTLIDINAKHDLDLPEYEEPN
ncbi:MAG: regulator of chromosome condensation [Clostridia bacterium]|jgi:alpha-tubulin suppressor-like RCC1 family protein|nr:regulator of chromosome condensation [Clostridia bacterium]